MRAGRHYALFTFSGIRHSYGHSELQVGIVRPLRVFGPELVNLFSPFCPQRQESLRNLARGGVDACVYGTRTGRGRCVNWLGSDQLSADATGQVGSMFAWQGMEAFDNVSLNLFSP